MEDASSLMNLIVRCSNVRGKATRQNGKREMAYRNAEQPPLERLRAEALALDVPPQGHEALSRNVDVRVGLDRVQDLDYAGVPQCAELLEGIARQWEARLVGGDVKGEDAAVRPVFLWQC